ncbi:MAG: transglycosylase domain-containing protein, partial [Firmicutes bacterium]|nr:transglycosylase domain-containing protein [Bacillota bacterium]
MSKDREKLTGGSDRRSLGRETASQTSSHGSGRAAPANRAAQNSTQRSSASSGVRRSDEPGAAPKGVPGRSPKGGAASPAGAMRAATGASGASVAKGGSSAAGSGSGSTAKSHAGTGAGGSGTGKGGSGTGQGGGGGGGKGGNGNGKRPQPRARRPRRALWKRMLMGLGFCTTFFVAMVAAFLWLINLPPSVNLSLLQVSSAPSYVYDRNGNLLFTLPPQQPVTAPLSEIPVRLQDALIATEDAGFYQHSGFSL